MFRRAFLLIFILGSFVAAKTSIAAGARLLVSDTGKINVTFDTEVGVEYTLSGFSEISTHKVKPTRIKKRV
jgi:hypothetical protein